MYKLQPPLCCPVLIPNSLKPETFSFPHRDFDQFLIAFLLIFTLAPFCYHLKTLTVTAHMILKKPLTPSELFLKALSILRLKVRATILVPWSWPQSVFIAPWLATLEKNLPRSSLQLLCSYCSLLAEVVYIFLLSTTQMRSLSKLRVFYLLSTKM